MFDRFEVGKVLIIAPKRVAESVWDVEAVKWSHTRHLRFSKILGNATQRITALRAKADIYLINRENVVWLISYLGGAWPFDMLVVDELSSFKAHDSQRFKSLRVIRPRIDRVVGLTGTPAPNGLLDLWAQLYLLDSGERLGNSYHGYRQRYFKKQNEYTPHSKFEILKGQADQGEDYYAEKIYAKISDICISMKAEDYLELPERLDQVVEVQLPPEIMRKYEQFERDCVLAMPDEKDITAVNAAALTGKLLQFANGAVYNDPVTRAYSEVHNCKLEALEADIEAANGSPVLVFYQFKHDVERIQKHLKHLKPHVLGGPGDVVRWNEGRIPFLLAHAASAGHGLNMQDGGHLMCWYGLPWSLEPYQQAVARLDRQGQKQVVLNRRLVAAGTMDLDVVAALDRKAGGQEALMQAVKARVDKYR
jgi:SNF2 family DNA or RNA helicase